LDLVGALKGARLFIDTSPFIYFIEGHSEYGKLVRPVFRMVDTGRIEAITSTITLLEVLVRPLKTGNKILAERYREILLNSKGLSTFAIGHEAAEKAANLRAKYSLRTPDALQVSVGQLYGAEKFLTNDQRLKGLKEIEVVTLDDFLNT